MTNQTPPNKKIHQADDDHIVVTGRTRRVVIALQKFILLITRYWFLVANMLTITILAVAILAPTFMAEGMISAGHRTYKLLAPHNHQLPQRSYFLFSAAGGVQTYSKEQLIFFGADPDNLEAFLGSPELGYKTALNHRMMAIFIAILGGGLVWGFTGQRPCITFYLLVILAIPMLADGLSHMISDNGDTDFRQTNEWAVALTGGAFPAAFYQGTTLGTLNWWLRTLTGTLFGLGLVWWLYSYLSAQFKPVRAKIEPRLRKAKIIR